MAKESVLGGTTSHSVNIFIQDSSSTVGAGLSGLVFNTSGLVASYTFTGANATRTAITLATLAAVNSAFSSGGFKELDATNMKGGYRLDIPNAALAAASGQTVTFELHGATNMAPCWFEIELTATNNQDGVRGGMTALPNAAAAASGGLIILGSNNTAAITIGALTAGAVSMTTLTASGAVAFQSTFAVTGTTTLTGAVSLGSTLGITGTTTLAALTTTGTVTMNALTVSNATTLTGAVSLGSTLGVTGTTTFAAINTGTITTTGNRSISGTTTMTGAVTANNASNNITGVTTTATVQTGTAQAGSTTSITLSAGASATNGLYDPGMVRIISGTGAGQARVILQYDGATKIATIDRDWRTNPDNTSVYEIIATANLISTNEGLAQAGAGSTITLNASASAVNNSYIGQTISIRAGTGQDQSRNITNYVGATKVATVDAAWSTNPDSTSVYVIWPLGRAMTVALGSTLDFNATMKTSLNAATPVATLSSAYDFAKGTSAMTESYAANGIAPTPVQAMFAIHQYLQQFTIATTNYTVKKLDNSTTAFVVTLNDATAPTAATRT